MTRHSPDTHLRLFYEQVTILSAESIAIAGEPLNALGTADSGASASLTSPALALLQNALYQYAYMRPFTGTLPPPAPPRDPQAAARFQDDLQRANTGRTYWDDGWTVTEIAPAGELLVTKERRTRLVRPGEYIHLDGVGSGVQVGRPVRLFFPADSTTLQSSFYFVFGEAADPRFDPTAVVRFYWNLAPAGAALLVQSLTARLNQFQIPFRFKCANDPASYEQRTDSAVLYVNPRFQPITAELLADVYQTVSPYMQPDVPLFTYPIAPGLAFAEDPANGDSFGMSRCRIVAEGVWQAHQNGDDSVAGRAAAVKSRFAAYELAWEQPYLNPDSAQPYHFPQIEAIGYERAA